MLAFLLAAQLTSVTPAYITQAQKKPTDDPAVVEHSFLARQKCPDEMDTMRDYSVTGKYPQLADDSPAARAINRAIRDEVVTLVASDVPDCPAPVKVSKEKDADGEIECECTVQLHTKRIFSVRCESSSSGPGFGAHPQDHITDFIFDATNGRRLNLDTVLLDGSRDRFRALAKKALDIAGMIDPAKLSPDTIEAMIDEVLKQCYVDKESITCEAPYWPATYFTSAVSFDELAGIARPDFLAAARGK